MLAAIISGVAVGTLMGLLGAGGSVLAVPALVFGVGMSVHAAIPASLAVVGASAVAGIVPRLRQSRIRWGVALAFAVPGLPAAYAGTAIGRQLPERWLMLGFAAVMAVVAVRMLTSSSGGGGACRTGTGGVDVRRCMPKAAAAGAAVGLLTGLFGVGGGFAVVPALTLLLGLDAAEAVATSLVVVALNSASGLSAHLGAAPVDGADAAVIAGFAATAVATSLVAGRLSRRIAADRLRRAFGAAVLAVAAGTAAAAVWAPGLLAG
ncbi:sulfite exporter TauE/SafE family protein [Nocardiopsis suaedae]|uniref:Probable membrane transporter protein n=1 Tax=Nocardiopsis suaedae TaxID=3018444 RepID=A0ABT4TFZ1_9ACTN|nr:sulfite exporter TauE/SafE family protein [Nocardiopsis suaedae]MDA2803609.1 sulfite exporter TauE/SafE family protein [Nocardiopsis suaedae]